MKGNTLRTDGLACHGDVVPPAVAAQGDAAGYELAYRAGLQAVAEQASVLRETRDRAGSLMSAAAVAGGLAAGLAFSSDRAGAIDAPGTVGAVFAILGFVVIVVTTVMIWRPTEGRFVHDAGVIIGSYVEGDPPASPNSIASSRSGWVSRRSPTDRCWKYS